MRIERYLVAVEALEEHDCQPPTAAEVADSIHGCASPSRRKTTQQALKRAADEGLVIAGMRIVSVGSGVSLRRCPMITYSISADGEERLEEPEWE